MAIFIFNPFIKIFKIDNSYLLYNPLNQELAIIDKKTYTLFLNGVELENFSCAEYLELKNFDFIKDINSDNLKYFYNRINKINDTKNYGIHVMYLVLHSKCSLNCNYCFVKKNFNNLSLTKTEIKKSLLLFKNQKSKLKKRIILYGGEPLLDFDLFKYTLKEIRSVFKNNIDISVVTNGVNLDQNYIDVLKKEKISVALSIDGFLPRENSQRVDLTGNSGHKKIISAYNLLKKNNISIAISCTLTEKNISHLKNFVNKLDDNVVAFSYNLLHTKHKKYSNKLVKELYDLMGLCLKKNIFEDRIYVRRFLGLLRNNFYIKDCAGMGNQLVVVPGGNIGICHGYNWNHKEYFNYNINNIDLDLDFQKDYVWKIWNKRSTTNMPVCWNCIGLTLCGGGCAVNKTNGVDLNIYKLDPENCVLYKKIITLLLKDIGKKMIHEKLSKNKRI